MIDVILVFWHTDHLEHSHISTSSSGKWDLHTNNDAHTNRNWQKGQMPNV